MLSFNPGTDYEVVFVSFDTSDTPDAALKKKHEALRRFARPTTDSGWHFPYRDARNRLTRVTKAGEFQLQLRRKEQDVRARQRHPAANAGWKNFSVLFWRGISGKQRAAGSGGCFGGENRDSCRSPIAVSVTSMTRRGRGYSATILTVIRMGAVVTIFCMVLGL